ncbi:MAG: peptidase, partial [Gemmatimonadetes bacterium]|nr:peptidase [Gemmatimonadota bacterium]NIR75915.1 peptidase [Candidatus Kutchimonas denitrificans]NIT67008.1 peptidase [Gemmatimonadota bacterium]NIY35585.1 peptidase [Gemmatimonadota bacterium]
EMAKHLPQIDDVEVDVDRVDRSADSTTYRVTVGWTNSGRLPTALRQAQLVKIVQEDRVRLQFDSTLTAREDPKVRIVDPATYDKTIEAGWTEPGESKSVSFTVRTYGVPGVEGEVEVLSTRGGRVNVPLILGRPEDD